MLNAIVTAGGPMPRELAHHHPAKFKALLPVGGRSLLDQALLALRESGAVDRIAVVGNDEVAASLPKDSEHVPAGSGAVDNILRGYQSLGADEQAQYLILSPDLPFVSAQALSSFVAAARDSSELAVPLVSREDFLQHYPGAPNFFETVDGRAVTMGSAIFVTGRMLKTNIPLWTDFYNARKAPLKIAALLGFPVILGFLTRSLRLAKLEARLSRLHGGVSRAVEVREASIAYDIDNKANYEYALRHAEKASRSI